MAIFYDFDDCLDYRGWESVALRLYGLKKVWNLITLYNRFVELYNAYTPLRLHHQYPEYKQI